MYRGNKEYFALKRQLICESKEKLNQLPIERSTNFNPKQSTPKGLTFVYEWCDNGIDILGYGCNSDGDACCIRPQIKPGLFVVSCDIPILARVCALHGYEIEVYDIKYDTNNFSAWELLQNYSVCQQGNLVKIITHTVMNAEKLYNKFKYNQSSYKYVGVQQYFNIVSQIMFELLINKHALHRNNNSPMDYSVPKTSMMWFDEHLNTYSNYSEPIVPIITFDIETVSSDPHRVPTGDACDDKLFTVSIHHTHTNILYTLIYLPLDLSPQTMIELIRTDGYDIVPDKNVDSSKCTNVLRCFNNERDLLSETMSLLTLKPKLHFLLGYNSIGYDIKYLLMRCAFFRLDVDRFVWREGYNFGIEQMHLDLFRIIVMRYRFKSYKLDDVSREILKDSKTGVSAVNLRYTFFRMIKYGRYFKNNECSAKMPSIKDTLEYNNADTLLVSKLEARTKSIQFIISRSQDCQVPLTSMNTNYNKMQYKLWNECFVVGIGLQIFLATFKQPTASFKIEVSSKYSENDLYDINVCLTDNLNSNESTNSQEKASPSYTRYNTRKSQFPGGANFCLGEKNVDNVQMYDYVTAYPILMDRKNISDETTTIIPANILLALYTKIQNIETFKTYDYLAHNGSTKSETIILYYQYIYENLYCGGEFPFTIEELKKRQHAPVIVIWEGRKGILSRIISHFSSVRAATKLKRKALDEFYDTVINKKNNLAATKILMDNFLATHSEEKPVTSSIDENCVFGLDECDMSDIENDEKCDMTDIENNKESIDKNFGFDDDEDGEQDSIQDGIEDSKSTQNFGIEDSDDETIDDLNINSDTSLQTNYYSIPNHFNSKFISTYGTLYVLNEEELMKEPDPMKTISELADLIALERNNISNSYDLQKSVVSSIYGCVGKMIVVVAAVITSMTRSTLLASAQYCKSLGYEILYIDTDSIMISGCNDDLSPELNRLYPFMEMEMKLARKCMFVKRKTYYKIEDGSLKYGQNVNGPKSWRECVEYFYNRDTITTNPDIYQAFYDFFMGIYKELQSFADVSPEFLQCFTQTIKTKDEYKTMTVAKKFKMYLAENYPALAGASKHTIFYYLDNSVLTPCLRPDLDITTKDDLRFVNLFKYYQNMYTTIFNLIKFHVRKNNEPYNITLSSKYVLLLMLKGFIDAYETTFLTPAINDDDEVCKNLTINSDAELVFSEPIHTEILPNDDD